MTVVRYTTTAIILHWLMALLLFGLLGIGFYMADLPLSPQKLQLYSWHKWIGVTVFLLVLLRLSWRLAHPAPALLSGMQSWEIYAAHGTHILLYGLMFAIPLSGWLMSSAAGFQVVYFGVLPLPDLVAKNTELKELFANIHGILNFILIGLVVLHIGAALKHQFIAKDNLLKRMSFL
ncbi:cytochrome b [Beggiatoa leptomitoformis]|uniref:Cytochrome b n=1 Tax=Beggiatoa leptomitoformis TaxID=288004 RepID=A0A2N9YHU0_9GAMM|nr:cytochrome b [Beggiatoa leptomitoformis]AUI70121.1 cytochrome b [Beggiatoa leptomitoformis]